MGSLIDSEIIFTHFPDSDTLAVTEVSREEQKSLLNSVIMPINYGVSVIVTCDSKEEIIDKAEEISKTLDKILPSNMSFNVIGVM